MKRGIISRQQCQQQQTDQQAGRKKAMEPPGRWPPGTGGQAGYVGHQLYIGFCTNKLFFFHSQGLCFDTVNGIQYTVYRKQ